MNWSRKVRKLHKKKKKILYNLHVWSSQRMPINQHCRFHNFQLIKPSLSEQLLWVTEHLSSSSKLLSVLWLENSLTFVISECQAKQRCGHLGGILIFPGSNLKNTRDETGIRKIITKIMPFASLKCDAKNKCNVHHYCVNSLI